MTLSDSPLMQAYNLLQKAALEGFDWDSPFAAGEKVREELEEVLEELHKPASIQQHAIHEEIGDLFLACVCFARHCNVDPDAAILSGIAKFKKRYARFKSYAQIEGISLQQASHDELSRLWQHLKHVNTEEN